MPRGCEKVHEGARRCREGFGCRERVQEAIEGAGGRQYHRLLARRRQERDMAYNVGSRYWWKVGVGGSSRAYEVCGRVVVGANSADREWECERWL
jgi:hypothetical protein